jgi:hypothetical protein
VEWLKEKKPAEKDEDGNIISWIYYEKGQHFVRVAAWIP